MKADRQVRIEFELENACYHCNGPLRYDNPAGDGWKAVCRQCGRWNQGLRVVAVDGVDITARNTTRQTIVLAGSAAVMSKAKRGILVEAKRLAKERTP